MSFWENTHICFLPKSLAWATGYIILSGSLRWCSITWIWKQTTAGQKNWKNSKAVNMINSSTLWKIMPHCLRDGVVLKWNSGLKKISTKISSIYIPSWPPSPYKPHKWPNNVYCQLLNNSFPSVATPVLVSHHPFPDFHKTDKKLINIETSILLFNLAENTKYYVLFEEDWHRSQSDHISFIYF